MLRNVEVIDLAPGLWIWRLEHPACSPDVDWQQALDRAAWTKQDVVNRLPHISHERGRSPW
jgi:hypothetical protein